MDAFQDHLINLSADGPEMVLRLAVGLLAGAAIGYERSFHGRPAGFRTHALVCMASSLLMLVTVYEAYWVRSVADSVRLDPTRMAQGIMTGIGFLGAGAIIKEGLSIRGLTTAASIWITAAIGVLAGIGFYFPLVVAVIFTLGVLSVFRWIEVRMPSESYYHFDVRFVRASEVTEAMLRELVERHGFTLANLSYRLEGEGRIRRHTMVLRTRRRGGPGALVQTLDRDTGVVEYRIAPAD
jgi:putative Mg2+ transporter-C (MgtC) family protein